MRQRLPVLWLAGPPGAGKTTVAWEIFSALTEAGTEAAYVDTDQLGICRPDPPGDPGRCRIRAWNLSAVLAGFQDAGARCAIVSGVIDAEEGVHPDASADAAVTVCRLHADRDELRRRLVERRGATTEVEEMLGDAAALDRSPLADLWVDTTGLSVGEVVRRVRELSDGWDRGSPLQGGPPVAEQAPAPLPSDGTRVLLLYGATGVGKSTVGFQLFLRAAEAGRRVAYVDLRQVGIHRPAPTGDPRSHRLRARNAGALWQQYRAAGVQDLVLVGRAESQCDVDQYTAALGEPGVTICRLHAGREDLRRRIRLRGLGGSWPEPGDPLKGRSVASLSQIAEEAAVESEALERAGIAGLRIATDGASAEETAGAVAAAVGWP